MSPPLLSIVYITGDRDPLPALKAAVTQNRRDDVEWVVVDNRTQPGEQPADIQGAAVRWIPAPPGDGHAALNRGAAAALGSLVLPLFAGDELRAGAISRLINEWRQIPLERAARYSGITAVAAIRSAAGQSAEPFPFESADLEPAQLRYEQRWRGEPLFIMRVELLRARPLPSPGGPLPPLGMVWRVAGRGFLTHAVSAELATRALPAEPSPRAVRLDALAALTHDLRWLRTDPRAFHDAAVTYRIAGRELKIGPRRQLLDLNEDAAKALWVAAWLPSRRRSLRSAPASGTRAADEPAPARRSPGTTLFLTTSLDAGIADHFTPVAIGLHERRVGVRVIAFDGGAYERDLREAGVPLTMLEPRGRWDLVRLIRQLTPLLRETKPAVVASIEPGPNLLALLLRRVHRARVVWMVTGDERDSWSDRIARQAEKRLARFVPALIASRQSDYDRAVAAGYPARRIAIVPAGIDLDRFRHDADGRASLRTAWRVTDRAPLIGRVGRITPDGDHATFLQAAAIVGRARPEARFVCVGGGPNSRVAEMQRLSRTLGLGERVIWTGPISITASVYSALDLCVSSAATAVGLPESIAEAMACGTPVVATDAGESAWLIGDDRFVVPPQDPGALAARILQLLDDLEAGLADPAILRARVARELSIDRLLDRIEHVFSG